MTTARAGAEREAIGRVVRDGPFRPLDGQRGDPAEVIAIAERRVAGHQHVAVVEIGIHQFGCFFEERHRIGDPALAESQEGDLLVDFPVVRIEPHRGGKRFVGLGDLALVLQVTRLDAVSLGDVRIER